MSKGDPWILDTSSGFLFTLVIMCYQVVWESRIGELGICCSARYVSEELYSPLQEGQY